MKTRILLVLMMLVTTATQAQFVLSTVPPLTGGTSTTGGISFNLRANSSAFIDTVYCRFTTAVNTTTDFRLWYSATDTSGPVTVAAPNWVSLQEPVSLTVGTPNQLGVPQIVAIPIPGGLLINAGATYRFYVGVVSGSVSYNSLSAGIVDYYSDGNLTIATGALISYAGPFPSPTLTPRAFNGGVAYRFATGLDARPSALISPQTLMIGANPVTVRVQNAAATPITSATIGYQVDNNPAVITATHTFNAPISPGQTEDYTFPTPITIPAQATINLKVWTTNANGNGPDVNTSNDTLYRTLCTGISGTFSVGGPSANYPTISAAVQALNQCGITGPVTFNINPGTYYGSYVLGNIPGANSANQITFTSATAQAADVILIHDTATTAQTRSNFVVGGNSRVAFQYLTFRRITVPSAAGQSAVLFTANAESGQVIGCVFDDQTLSTSTFNNGLTYQSSLGLILNNHFRGYYYAVFLEGQAAAPWKQLTTIQNNTFENHTYRCIYALNQDYVTIDNNIIEDFQGTSTAGAGIWLSNAYAATVSNNRIVGGMSAYGIISNNLNGDTLNPYSNTNRIFNNVISGQQASSIVSTTMVINPIYIGASFAANATPPNPRDAVEIVNNTIIYSVNTTVSSTVQAGVYFLGGTTAAPGFSYLHFRNNHVEVNPTVGSLPASFRLMRFANTAIIDSLISGNNNYMMTGTTLPPYFRENGVGTDYATVANWRTLTGRDTLSGSINPAFISASLPIPTSIGFDNRGAPVGFVTTDITGASRSATTPDIGAYEFVGSIFSQITFTPLSDTLTATQRLLTVSITDSISTITAGTARLFYKKPSQSNWQLDSLPGISGTNYTFNINYANLGGVSSLDTIQYYIAVRNATNTVTTSPLGGNGLYLSNQQVPPIVHSYLILPVISGNYRVGVSGPAEFPTITAAANFLSLGLVNGPTTFILIDTLYSTGETFPINILGRPGMSATNTVTFRPDVSRSQVRIEGSATGSTGLINLRAVKHFILDGSNNGTSSRNLSIRSNSSVASSTVIWLRSVVGETIENTTIKNLNIIGGSNTVTSTFGIAAQGATLGTTGTADGINNLTIDNVSVSRAYYGIFARNTVANPGSGLVISNCSIGSLDTASFVIFRGIDVQNFVGTSIRDNEVFNLVSATATTQAAIEVGGTSSRLVRINRNKIWGIKNLNTGGWGAYGINVLAGDSVVIDNNLAYDLRTVNYSNTSQSFNAFGIRLGAGLAHRVHYNSVYLYGSYTNATTSGASASAFGIASTAVTADVRNNIFAIDATSSTVASFFTAIWVPAAYNFGNLTLNNNAYHVAPNSQCYVGRVGITAGSGNYLTVADWKLISSVGNPNNDNLSVPPLGRSLPPFVSTTNLTIAAGTVTGIESGAVVIPALGTPNTDYTGANRPAGTGTGPDMGAYEFAGVALPDIFPPSIDSARITPLGNLCVPTARTITVHARDNSGGSGIDTIRVNRIIGGVAAPAIVLTRTSGSSAQGVWTGTIPPGGSNLLVELSVTARDSLGNFAPTFGSFTYKDDYLTVNAGNDTTITQGDSATLRANTGFAGSSSLATMNTGGNGCGGGAMFDLTATSGALLITGFDIRANAAGSQQVIVWTRTGTHQGNELSSAGWTAVDTITFNGTVGVLANIPLNNPFIIQQGQVTGIFMNYNASYTNGSAVISNANLSINVGAGLCGQFTGLNAGRQFNGAVYYAAAATVSWSTSAGTVVGTGNTIRVSPNTTTTYIATVTDGTCTKTDTVVVTVNPLNLTPDIGVSRIVSPTSTTVLNTTTPVPVIVMVKNFGTIPASGFDVEYRVNGGASIITNSITQTLAPGDSMMHTFTLAWTPPTTGGNYTICANTTGMPNEINRANDTSCISITTTISVENLYANNRLIGNVYPNPAESFVNFEFNEFQGKGTLEIHDKLGRVVANIAVDRENGHVHTLRTDSWSAGMYSYRFIARDQVQHGNLIIRQ